MCGPKEADIASLTSISRWTDEKVMITKTKRKEAIRERLTKHKGSFSVDGADRVAQGSLRKIQCLASNTWDTTTRQPVSDLLALRPVEAGTAEFLAQFDREHLAEVMPEGRTMKDVWSGGAADSCAGAVKELSNVLDLENNDENPVSMGCYHHKRQKPLEKAQV